MNDHRRKKINQAIDLIETAKLIVQEVAEEGDIDRVFIEWRSLLRRIAHAPALPEHTRWTSLKERAGQILDETESPTHTDLPTLEYHQTQRCEHRLKLRRH